MYLKVHPSGEDHLWTMFKVPDAYGMTAKVRRVAEEYARETGHRAEAVSNYDARHYRSLLRWSSRSNKIIEDPDVFVSLFLN